MHRWWLTQWYHKKPSPWLWPLLPLSWLYGTFMRWRHWAYQHGWLTSTALPVPVWVVGNITVGGTGKTALVIYLLQFLQQRGYRPGIVSRGYGGTQRTLPHIVTTRSSVQEVGDEALLLVQKTQCPMVIAPNRVRAAQTLLAHSPCDIIISDDGLQHLALDRTLEVVIIDGMRGLGNGRCLPAGPLREPKQRLAHIDCVIYHGQSAHHPYCMQRHIEQCYLLSNPQDKRPLSSFKGQSMQLITAIGHPERLYKDLISAGIRVMHTHYFADHHHYQETDLKACAPHIPLITTEKDAIKLTSCTHNGPIWVLSEKISVSKPLSSYFEKCATLILRVTKWRVAMGFNFKNLVDKITEAGKNVDVKGLVDKAKSGAQSAVDVASSVVDTQKKPQTVETMQAELAKYEAKVAELKAAISQAQSAQNTTPAAKEPEPQAAEPEAKEPEPQAPEPEASEPEAKEPEPQVPEPEAPEPEAKGPEPQAPEPEASEPEAPEPEASEPEASESETKEDEADSNQDTPATAEEPTTPADKSADEDKDKDKD